MIRQNTIKMEMQNTMPLKKVVTADQSKDMTIESSKSSSFVSFRERSDFSLANYSDEIDFQPQFPMPIRYGGKSYDEDTMPPLPQKTSPAIKI